MISFICLGFLPWLLYFEFLTGKFAKEYNILSFIKDIYLSYENLYGLNKDNFNHLDEESLAFAAQSKEKNSISYKSILDIFGKAFFPSMFQHNGILSKVKSSYSLHELQFSELVPIKSVYIEDSPELYLEGIGTTSVVNIASSAQSDGPSGNAGVNPPAGSPAGDNPPAGPPAGPSGNADGDPAGRPGSAMSPVDPNTYRWSIVQREDGTWPAATHSAQNLDSRTPDVHVGWTIVVSFEQYLSLKEDWAVAKLKYLNALNTAQFLSKNKCDTDSYENSSCSDHDSDDSLWDKPKW